uniref:Uncharacterized protein n=1 Tax=Pseudomonas phage Touem01 TaxID=3138548 RepID=A0AAU6W385_9VIRU
MIKISDLKAATRARLEAAGITGFHINNSLLTIGVNQPDFIAFIPLPGNSGAVHRSFDAGPNAPLVPRNWSLEPRLKRARALGMSDITRITADDLDDLLSPYMAVGILRTTYERCTGAIEYRGPSGRVFAVSIGDNHFARRQSYPAASLAMFAQQVGRITREHVMVRGDQNTGATKGIPR